MRADATLPLKIPPELPTERPDKSGPVDLDGFVSRYPDGGMKRASDECPDGGELGWYRGLKARP